MPDALERTLQPTRRVIGDVDLAQPLDTTHPLLEGLEGFWLPLPSTSGGSRLYDLSAQGYHASLTNAPTWTTGRFGPTLDYNGTDQLAAFAPDPIKAIAQAGEGTWAAWAYPRDDSSDASIFNAATWVKLWLDVGGSQKDWKIALWDVDINATVVGAETNVAQLNAWQHVAVTWDGSTLSLYVDGEQKGSGSFTDLRSRDVDVGIAGQPTDEKNYFDGLIEGPAMWRRALSVNEVRTLYDTTRRGFRDLLRTRSGVGVLSGGGGAVSLAPNSLQHGHTISQAGFGVSYDLAPQGLQHTHTLSQSGVTVNYTLVPEDALHGHTLEETAIGSVVVLSPDDMRHGHTLEGTLLEVTYDLGPDSLTHAHTTEETGVQVAYVLAPSGMSHAHALEQTAIVLPSDAAFIDVEVRPKYTIDVSAEPKIK